MGSKGSTRHSKRLSAPVTYAIKRKHGVFTIRPFPTRGPFDLSIPLGIVVREKLGYAKTLNEAKKILHNKFIKIDGRVRAHYKYSLGLMDVLEVTKTKEFYRLVPFKGKKRVTLHPITEEEAKKKLLQVRKKHSMKGGLIQFTFHDGTSKAINPAEKYSINFNEISPKDTVLYNIESGEYEEHYPFAENNMGVIIGGHSVGLLGKITEIETQLGRKMRTITFQTEEGEFKTTDTHIFIVGKEKAMLSLPQPEGVLENES
ncbi:MAG: 30S ribosomal protein S4e [Candidatus Hodarchaeales archaeon]|jgi:small subunit ribosomal protein S4e